jgi:large subunit ribosomal protein L18
MDNSLIKRNLCRQRRVWRVRKKVRGDDMKPRLSVYKSNQHISAQVIDDQNHRTLFSAGTQHAVFNKEGRKRKDCAREIGRLIAEKAKEHAITTVVFDRGRYKFHGIIAELAAGAREAGLRF